MTTVVFGEALVDDFPTEQVVGGAPFNVARHLAAFMAPQLMITRIGADQNGAAVRAEFERFAMSHRPAARSDGRNRPRGGRAHRPKGHRFGSCRARPTTTSTPKRAAASLADVDAGIVYFGTLAQREEAFARGPGRRAGGDAGQALPRPEPARPASMSTSVVIVARSLDAADIVKVNEEELQSLFQWYFQIGPNDAPLAIEEVRAACARCCRSFRWQALIVTLGHRGSVVLPARWRPRSPPRHAGAALRDRHGGRGRCVLGDLPAGPRARLAARTDAGARQRIRRRDLRDRWRRAARPGVLRQVGGPLARRRAGDALGVYISLTTSR
jgi:fructokinase